MGSLMQHHESYSLFLTRAYKDSPMSPVITNMLILKKDWDEKRYLVLLYYCRETLDLYGPQ